MMREIKKTSEIRESIEFHSGTISEIADYLAGLESEFIKNQNKYVCILEGDYVLTSIYFDHSWSGYEDHDFFLVAKIEESDACFEKRTAAEAAKKEKEAQELKKRQEANRLASEKRRLDQIKKLKEKLAELERKP